MTVFLIDGYNVLHAWRKSPAGESARRPKKHPKRKAQADPGLDDAALDAERRRLIDRIAGYIAARGDRAVIVFDSKSATLEDVQTTAAGVTVYFGSFSRSADAIIEREAYGLQQEETLVVVTSDYAVQQTTFLPNVSRRSSRQFVQDLQRFTTRLANSESCITMGHRVEERLDEASLDRLKRLRDSLGREDDSD